MAPSSEKDPTRGTHSNRAQGAEFREALLGQHEQHVDQQQDAGEDAEGADGGEEDAARLAGSLGDLEPVGADHCHVRVETAKGPREELLQLLAIGRRCRSRVRATAHDEGRPLRDERLVLRLKARHCSRPDEEVVAGISELFLEGHEWCVDDLGDPQECLGSRVHRDVIADADLQVAGQGARDPCLARRGARAGANPRDLVERTRPPVVGLDEARAGSGRSVGRTQRNTDGRDRRGEAHQSGTRRRKAGSRRRPLVSRLVGHPRIDTARVLHGTVA
jgi:hypothetical protein